ncbi:sortilin-like [Tubulanus polymorphus]|uniref:sortilin-like n=1 Tax=Tubulanus polymorphus TaxID=672921 RepID=UPI003DA66EE7
MAQSSCNRIFIFVIISAIFLSFSESRLDELDSRAVDNVGVVHFESIADIQDSPVYLTRHKRDIGPEPNQEVKSSRNRRSTAEPTPDPVCIAQEAKITQLIKDNKDKSVLKHIFENETKYSLALAWAEENAARNTSRNNDDVHPHVIIAVTTQDFFGGMVVGPSSVYRSDDEGHSFKNITGSVNNGDQVFIQKGTGVQKHPHHLKKIIFIGYNKNGRTSTLYITDDGGLSFNSYDVPFRISGVINWHPNNQYSDYLLVFDAGRASVYLSIDGGRNFKMIRDKSTKFKWGEGSTDNGHTIFVQTDRDMKQTIGGMKSLSNKYDLQRSDDLGNTWTTIQRNIHTFGNQGKFLYASVYKDELKKTRSMRVSTDEGKTWNEAVLPSITPERFYSILDMNEGLIFMHVDNPEDTGHGILYTSDSTGVIFSESLAFHLYPNYQDLTDFYRVLSLKGVYIASQMLSDNSIQTVITFNRGATWQNVRRPSNAPCKDEGKKCFLQIHNLYSIVRNIKAKPPLSSPTATGIIMVHGHVADSLQITPPDVYVTSDGGYNWIKALDGPHLYQIADQGGLLVAVPMSADESNIIKFSTDEGRCWHNFTYTDEKIHVTGLLTEPGNKAMHVGIWGFLNQEWRTFIINFKEIIKKPCQTSDYEDWTAHTEMNTAMANKGCLLGQTETFKRPKKDSLCYNGRDWVPPKTVQKCQCTKDDYECDFGYYRPINTLECKQVSTYQKYVCIHGEEEVLKTQGYRKIPGDMCVGGFTPEVTSLVDLAMHCNGEIDVIDNSHLELAPGAKHTVIVATIVILVLVLVAFIAAYFGRKVYLLRKHNVTYRYSMLNQNAEEYDYDNDIENALTHSTSLYHDDEEEGETPFTEEVDSSKLPISNGKIPKNNFKSKSKVRSYHDDSDDDLLE